MTIDDLIPVPERSVDWPDPLPERMSPSSLTMFLSCPEQWRRRYLLGERQRSGHNLLIGIADGKARAGDLRHKILTGENLPAAVVKDICAEAFDFELEEAGGPGEIDDDGLTTGKAKDMAVACTGAYSDQIAAQIMPVALEHHVELELPNLPVMHGFIDIVEPDRIREEKTAKSRPGNMRPSAAHLTQTLLYSAVTGLPTHFDYTVKKQHPEVVSALSEPTLIAHPDSLVAGERLQRLLFSATMNILGLLDRLGPESYWPGTASAAAAASPCGWCGYRDDCPFVLR